VCHPWKNAPHLEKCGTLREVQHTWKKAAQLTKLATLGKNRAPWKNAALFKKWSSFKKIAPQLEKCGTLTK